MNSTLVSGRELLVQLTRFLAWNPTAVENLLAEHVDEDAGHCRACRIANQGGFHIWPCTLHAAASRARTALSSARR